jgi:hypothetical protein
MATQAELRQNVEWSKNFKNLSQREMAQLIEVGKKLASNWGPHLGKIV